MVPHDVRGLLAPSLSRPVGGVACVRDDVTDRPQDQRSGRMFLSNPGDGPGLPVTRDGVMSLDEHGQVAGHQVAVPRDECGSADLHRKRWLKPGRQRAIAYCADAVAETFPQPP